MIPAPITLKEANAFVAEFHRHAEPVRGSRFQLCVMETDCGPIVGVVIVGRPVARALQDGWTSEINRLCVRPGAPKGACSFLYGRAWRVWQQMGGRRMLTYTLADETGASLRGAGWKVIGENRGRGLEAWQRSEPGQHRRHRPIYEADKLLWEIRA